MKSAILGKEQILMTLSLDKKIQGTRGRNMDIGVTKPLYYFWKAVKHRETINFSESPCTMCTKKEYDTPRWSFDGLDGENKMVFKSETLLLNVLKAIKRKMGRSYLEQNLSVKSHMLRSFFSICCGQSLQTK